MQKLVRLTVALFAVTVLLVSTDASAKKAKIDKSEAQATSDTPEAAQVAKLSIPFDPNLPQFVVIVEPFDYSASGDVSGGGQSAPSGGVESNGEVYTQSSDGQIHTTFNASSAPAIGKGIAKQLQTALGGWANITIVEPDAVKHKDDGTYDLKLQPGEIGPFIVRGTVTEFTETAEADDHHHGFDSRKLGVATGIIGAITGSRTAMGVGAGVAVLGPNVKKERMKRTGMVGMDVRVIDGRIARATPGGNFDVHGTFTTIAAGGDVSVLGISGGNSEMAASSLGQATRAAMNDALLKAHDSLLNARR